MNALKDADRRRKKVQKMVDAGRSFKEIGNKLHVSSVRARQLFQRAKELDERPDFGMGLMLYRLVARALKLDAPTPVDIQKFIRQNPDWREQLLRVNRFGPKRLEEFESFCKENGILGQGKQ
jgi:transposase